MTPMPDIVGARFADYGVDEARDKAAALRSPVATSSNIAGDAGRSDAGTKKFVAPTEVVCETGGGGGRGRGGGAGRSGGRGGGRSGGGRGNASLVRRTTQDSLRHHVLVMKAPQQQYHQPSTKTGRKLTKRSASSLRTGTPALVNKKRTRL